MLSSPDAASGLKNLLPQLLEVLPAENPLQSCLGGRVASPQMTPSSQGNLHPMTGGCGGGKPCTITTTQSDSEGPPQLPSSPRCWRRPLLPLHQPAALPSLQSCFLLPFLPQMSIPRALSNQASTLHADPASVWHTGTGPSTHTCVWPNKYIF